MSLKVSQASPHLVDNLPGITDALKAIGAEGVAQAVRLPLHARLALYVAAQLVHAVELGFRWLSPASGQHGSSLGQILFQPIDGDPTEGLLESLSLSCRYLPTAPQAPCLRPSPR